MKYVAALALTLLSSSAFGADCRYANYREELTAVEAGDGYDIALADAMIVDGKQMKAGDVIDHCSSEPGDITRYSHCKGGWEGVLFFAGKDRSDPTPGEIMVLQNDVWFQECP